MGEIEGSTGPPSGGLLPSAEQVLHEAPLGLGVISADGRYVMANPALAAVLGRPVGQVLGVDPIDFLYPEDQEPARQALQRVLTGEAPRASGESRYVHADGAVVWTRLCIVAIRDPSGLVLGVVLQAEDVTAEREAAATEAKLGLLVSELDEGVLTLDGEGRITSWNAAAEALLGWSAPEIVGRSMTTLAPAAQRAREQDEFERLRAGQTLRADTVRLHRDGPEVEVRLVATPVLDGEGHLTAVIAVLHDIRDQLQHARKLQHLAGHDPLTGLPNRRETADRLQAAAERSRRSGDLVGLLFIDLDGFKSINDRCGHAVGDRFLQVVAGRLQGALRPTDVLGRWGGDEYLAIVEGAGTVDDVVAVAHRLVESLNRPLHVGDLMLPASASIGVSCTRGGRTAEQLLAAADSAMYLAKNNGGGQVAFVDGGVD